MKNLNRFSSLILATAVALTAGHAMAQAPAKKGDKIMTKDELRACMTLDQDNEMRTEAIDKRHEVLSKERDELEKVKDDTGPQRAEIDRLLEEVKQSDAKVAANATEIEDWNNRMAEFTKRKKDMRNASRREQVLKQERLKLEATNEQVVADRTAKVAAYEKAVEALNQHSAQRGAGNVEWNKRYEALRAEEAELNKSKDKWTKECSNRRFRENDEIAIKKELAAKKGK